MRVKVVLLTVPGLRVEGEIDSGARAVLDVRPSSIGPWLTVYNADCERGGYESNYKQLQVALSHIVSWRDAEPSGQEALDVPEPRDPTL